MRAILIIMLVAAFIGMAVFLSKSSKNIADLKGVGGDGKDLTMPTTPPKTEAQIKDEIKKAQDGRG